MGRWEGFGLAGIDGSGAGQCCKLSGEGDATVGIAVGIWEGFGWAGVGGGGTGLIFRLSGEGEVAMGVAV